MSRFEQIRSTLIGQDIHDVPKPAIILDVAVARRHCRSMLSVVKALGVDFRAHVKTHKTVELARLQQGDESRNANYITSTVAEIEHLVPLLTDYQSRGRKINVLHGIPLPASAASRLAKIALKLGPGTVSVLIDHVSQLSSVATIFAETQSPIGVYVKVDTGYHRAGLQPTMLNTGGLLGKLLELEVAGQATLLGLYSHTSLSYAGTSPREAMESLAGEISGCLLALQTHTSMLAGTYRELTISVGASPQAVSMQGFSETVGEPDEATAQLREMMQQITTGQPGGLKTKLELHAGVYSVSDMQQLATKARNSLGTVDEEVATFVMAEVCSVYNDGERQQPEALVAVGTLGLGHEPCHSYNGWGVVGRRSYPTPKGSTRRLIIERISQEHSIVSWEQDPEEIISSKVGLPPIPLEPGQSIRIYPNHACVTGAMYPWYLIVDSSEGKEATKVVDIWVRSDRW